jgi:hypothetical protein
VCGKLQLAAGDKEELKKALSTAAEEKAKRQAVRVIVALYRGLT